jgi:hypothetical protein
MNRVVRRHLVRKNPLLMCGVALLAACAVMESPSGGPEDKAPPRVVETTPTSDSAGVARDVSLRISFSEKVDPQSLKNRVFLFPAVEFASLKVKGERLEIGFKSLLPETTFCLLIGAGIRDYHRVESKQNSFLFFSTADSIARGEISGAISFKNAPDSAGVAELFAVRADSVTDFHTAKRARIAFAGRDGRFTFRALPTDGSRFLMRVFIDRDADGRYSAGKEFAAILPDTVSLKRSRDRLEDIRINVIDPNEPGKVEGRVINETAFKAAPTVRLGPVKPGESALSAQTDSTGNFVLRAVPPGSYLVSAFIDLKPDTLCGTYFDAADTTKVLPEPCVTLPDTLRVKPGELKTLDPVSVR